MPYWISAIRFVFDLQLIRSVVSFTSLICRFDSPVSEERTGEMLASANTHGCFSETRPISHSSVLAKRTRHKCLLNNQNIPPQRASGVRRIGWRSLEESGKSLCHFCLNMLRFSPVIHLHNDLSMKRRVQ